MVILPTDVNEAMALAEAYMSTLPNDLRLTLHYTTDIASYECIIWSESRKDIPRYVFFESIHDYSTSVELYLDLCDKLDAYEKKINETSTPFMRLLALARERGMTCTQSYDPKTRKINAIFVIPLEDGSIDTFKMEYDPVIHGNWMSDEFCMAFEREYLGRA